MSRSDFSGNAGRAIQAKGDGHAVVIGGSMAGLLAGRVLADHFERVTILERDRCPVEPGPRKGVPQARHAHVLLTRGQRILEELFPGLVAELAGYGPLVDAAEDVAWLTPAGWAVRFRSGLEMLSVSRDLLEWSVRRRVAAVPGVHFREGADVTGLLPDVAGSGVKGVWVRFRGPAGDSSAGEERLEADLVVEAGGRGSRAPRWLEALGYLSPEETVVTPFLGYASRLYRRPAGKSPGWKGLYLQSQPPEGTRGGLIIPVEGDRWVVTLSGRCGDYPPTDEKEFLDFARSLPSPVLSDAIKDAEPLSPITSYRGTENRLRHFERLPRWPESFVVLGDAACAFNPVYGQGMTTAALGAITLGDCLRRQGGLRAGLARSFQKELARVNAVPWLLATGEDLRYPATTGARPGRVSRLMQQYVDQVVRLSTKNAHARQLFLEVLHLLRPPTALFSPRVLLSLLGQALRPAPGGQADPSPVATAEVMPLAKGGAHLSGAGS